MTEKKIIGFMWRDKLRKLQTAAKKKRKTLLLLFASALFIVLAGLAVDLACQWETLALPKEEKGIFTVSDDSMLFDGFQQTENGWMLSGGSGALTVDADGAFVGRFCFSYQYEGRLEATWYVWDGQDEQPEIIEDSNSALIGTSVERLDKNVEQIRIEWTLDEDSSPLTVTDVYLVNAYSPNWHRMFFV